MNNNELKLVNWINIFLITINFITLNYLGDKEFYLTLIQGIIIEAFVSIYLLFFIYKPLEDEYNDGINNKKKICIYVIVIRLVVMVVGLKISSTLFPIIDALLILFKTYILFPIAFNKAKDKNYLMKRQMEAIQKVEELKNNENFVEKVEEADVDLEFLLPEKEFLERYVKKIAKEELNIELSNNKTISKIITNMKKYPNEEIKKIIEVSK